MSVRVPIAFLVLLLLIPQANARNKKKQVLPEYVLRAQTDLWLDPGFTDVTAVSDMLKPYDARPMRCFPVSARINQVQNDDAEYAKPVSWNRRHRRVVLAKG
jgi:putative SOS response-associated peptidase YedK